MPRRTWRAAHSEIPSPLTMVAYIADELAMGRIREDRACLSENGPPPEVRYISLDEEGREMPGRVASSGPGQEFRTNPTGGASPLR